MAVTDRSAVMTGLKLLTILVLLPSCTVRPMIKVGDSFVSLGGSVFTKSANESASYSGPLGTLRYADNGKDETVIPGKVVNYWGLKAAIDGATSAMRTKESTTRILAKEETKKVGLKTAADVEKVKILNPVEEAAPAVVPGFDQATGLNIIPR